MMEWPVAVPEEMKAEFRANPFNPVIWFNLGALAHNADDEAQAWRGFQRALLCEPAFTSAHGHMTIMTAKRNGPISALKAARRLSRIVPASAQVRALATQYLFEAGQDLQVEPAGRRALVLDPTSAGLYRLMALSASRLQEMPSAAGLLRRALILQPDWEAARLALAGAWFALEEFELLLSVLSPIGPHIAEAAMLRGRAFLELGRRGEAEESFATAIRLDPARQFDVDMARRTMDVSLFE
jgi:tetratricopeptide (TPR) repeat protein